MMTKSPCDCGCGQAVRGYAYTRRETRVIGTDETGRPIKERRWLDFVSQSHAQAWVVRKDEAILQHYQRQMPGVRHRRIEDIPACPQPTLLGHPCGDLILRALPGRIGVLCTFGHTTFALEGDWGAEGAKPQQRSVQDGLPDHVGATPGRRRRRQNGAPPPRYAVALS